MKKTTKTTRAVSRTNRPRKGLKVRTAVRAGGGWDSGGDEVVAYSTTRRYPG